MMMLLFREHVGKSVQSNFHISDEFFLANIFYFLQKSVKENVDEWDNILPMTSIADSETAGRLTGDSC